jgi:protein-tyrosine-phosphatase
MSIEILSRQERADRHAALSDVLRLTIVDALALNDLSPGEIGQLVDAPSNLVAHHLRVLRQAGLVTRVRSQGDARRTYIQLVPDAFDGLIASEPWTADRVLFVCRHNSARSQLAEALWRQVSNVPVASAGTHPAARVHPGAVAVARRHRVPMARPKTHSLDEVQQATDLLITLCDEAHEELGADPARQVWHWSVPDPVRIGTDEAFDDAYDQISARVQRAATSSTRTEEPPL